MRMLKTTNCWRTPLSEYPQMMRGPMGHGEGGLQRGEPSASMEPVSEAAGTNAAGLSPELTDTCKLHTIIVQMLGTWPQLWVLFTPYVCQDVILC